MRLLRDEQAYRQLLNDFVGLRLDTSTFLARWRHLWQCDGAEGIDGVIAMKGAAPGQAGLYGLLDSVDTLCESYARSVPDGCGYRVSAEQFRKEIDGMTAAWLHGRRGAA